MNKDNYYCCKENETVKEVTLLIFVWGFNDQLQDHECGYVFIVLSYIKHTCDYNVSMLEML